MFREGADWDSGACGCRPAAERVDLCTRGEQALERQTRTDRNSLDTYSSRVQKCLLLFIMINAGEAHLCDS